MAYIQQSDLEALLSAPVVLAIYDDQNTGAVNQAVLNEILQLASSRVDSYLATVYAGPFPITQFPIPTMIKDAALAWARAFSFERHSEYVRQHGKTPRKEAEDLCTRLTEAREYLTDYLAQPQPSNTGGIVLNNGPRMLVDGIDGTYNSGDF